MRPEQRNPPSVINQIYHHTLLAHGYAVEAVREFGGKRARIGLAHNPPTPVPVTETAGRHRGGPRGIPAGNRATDGAASGDLHRLVLENVRAPMRRRSKPGDLDLISQKTDFLGLNVYFGEFVRRGPDGRVERMALPSQYPESGHFVAEYHAASDLLGGSSCPRSLRRRDVLHYRERRSVHGSVSCRTARFMTWVDASI